MAKLEIQRSTWAGNKWPCVDIYPYEDHYFFIVVAALCKNLNLGTPPVVDTLDGHVCDLDFEGRRITVMQDNWTCSIASESKSVRDKIFSILEVMDV